MDDPDQPVWYWEKNWEDFRRGTQQITLQWREEEASGHLYDQGVAETATAIRTALPLTIPVVHAAWSGEMVMSAEPVGVAPQGAENSVRLVRPGDLALDPKFGEVTLTYGTAEARLPTGDNVLVVFGHLDPDQPLLRRLGRACRFEGIQQVRLLEGERQ